MNLYAPRGTKDILPPLSLQWQYVEDKAKEVLALYNYEQTRTPIFEYTELFQRGIGEATDIVEKEMYTFDDKGGRSITLRPEGTASVVRSFIENKVYGQAQPTKYYYLGPMFRYERPQAGRFRQFHQLGVEVFGSNKPSLDAEVITLGLNILTELGLEDLELFINSIGCSGCREEYINVFKKYLDGYRNSLCSDCVKRYERNPLRVLDCKEDSCKNIIAEAPDILQYLCADCSNHFQKVKEYLDLLDIGYQVDPFLVRGLDYYTNTAFVIKYSGLGAQSEVLGGGRYNDLAEEVGGRSVPGIGFAMGLERLMLILDKQGIELPVETGIDLYITVIGERARKAAFKYMYQLRNAGFKVEIDYLDRSVKGQMKSADRMNARYTIIIGDNELESGQATIRNMKTGDQKQISIEELVERMEKMFSRRMGL
ncbi:MAG: histidine--tRNA ligase [Halanaerobiales bacterium]